MATNLNEQEDIWNNAGGTDQEFQAITRHLDQQEKENEFSATAAPAAPPPMDKFEPLSSKRAKAKLFESRLFYIRI
jgi:hypothetical protein